MSETQETIGESTSVIQEIEQQLETLLSRKRDDIERALAAAIQKEKDAARIKVDEVEKEFVQEREALVEFRTIVAEVEAERNTILEEVRERIKRALQFQAEVENLSKQTAEEIGKVNDLQQKLESLRQRTAERAGFLKKDLRERFGIITEVPDRDEAAAPGMDLDQELENLKRIKELLSTGLLRGGEEQQPLPEEGNP
jgi:chromosome segregation ATPase